MNHLLTRRVDLVHPLKGDGWALQSHRSSELVVVSASPAAASGVLRRSWPGARGIGMSVRKVQRFSGHRDRRTLTLHGDNRATLAGDVAAVVAGLL